MNNIDLRSNRTDEALNEQIVRLTDSITANRQAGDVHKILPAAVSRQVKIDVLHARALGQCDGCARAADLRWGHRLNCSTIYAAPRRGWTIAAGSDGAEVIVLD
jgi:hypothetical protein